MPAVRTATASTVAREQRSSPRDQRVVRHDRLDIDDPVRGANESGDRAHGHAGHDLVERARRGRVDVELERRVERGDRLADPRAELFRTARSLFLDARRSPAPATAPRLIQVALADLAHRVARQGVEEADLARALVGGELGRDVRDERVRVGLRLAVARDDPGDDALAEVRVG